MTEKKINELGRMLADMTLEISMLKRNVKQIRDWMLYPKRLALDRKLERIIKVSR